MGILHALTDKRRCFHKTRAVQSRPTRMAQKEKGPRGGAKHTPGRDHDNKSSRQKKKRFRKKASRVRTVRQSDLQKRWAKWDALPPEVQKLRPELKPREPRPVDET